MYIHIKTEIGIGDNKDDIDIGIAIDNFKKEPPTYLSSPTNVSSPPMTPPINGTYM